MSEDNAKDFKIYVPLDLEKADNEDSEWKIKGIASTGDSDLQGEQVEQDGLDISALQAGRGIWNYDHQKGPENVLGIIEDAKFITHEGKKALWVEGYLFKHQERAKAFYNILKSLKKGSASRVHMSIEGKILDRDRTNPTKIKKARIDKIAITMDPVNPYTFAELCKSLTSPSTIPETVETIKAVNEMVEIDKADLQVILDYCKKAMAAGAGYAGAPTAMTGGEVNTCESMDLKLKSVGMPINSEKKKKKKKLVIKSIMDSLITAYPSHNPLELAGWAIECFLDDENFKGDK